MRVDINRKSIYAALAAPAAVGTATDEAAVDRGFSAAADAVPVHHISADECVVRVLGDIALVRGLMNQVVGGEGVHRSDSYLTDARSLVDA